MQLSLLATGLDPASWAAAGVRDYSALAAPLPPAVQILTLAAWKERDQVAASHSTCQLLAIAVLMSNYSLSHC